MAARYRTELGQDMHELLQRYGLIVEGEPIHSIEAKENEISVTVMVEGKPWDTETRTARIGRLSRIEETAPAEQGETT